MKFEHHTTTIESFCLLGWKEISKKHLSEFESFYVLYHRKSVCCVDTLQTFYNSIESFYQSINPNYQRPMSNESKNLGGYILKNGMRLYCPSLPGYMTPVNATKELAIECLAENKARKNCFESLPENWEADVEAFKKSSKKAAEKGSSKEDADAAAEKKAAAAEKAAAEKK